MKASRGTCTRPVISRLAFAHRLAASVMTLRVTPDARMKKGRSNLHPTFPNRLLSHRRARKANRRPEPTLLASDQQPQPQRQRR
jgi:hypothetical protein